MLANDLDRLTAAQRTGLTGPGAMFELVEDVVRGVRMRVFARRPRHLSQVLLTAADRFGDRAYLCFPDVQLNYRETLRRVAVLAATLRDTYHIRPGDRVAVAGSNSAHHALLLWATTWLGAISVGLNGWWTGTELKYGLELTEPAVLIGDERQLARLDTIGGTTMPTATFHQVVDAADPATQAAPINPAVGEDDVAAILFTSGTTGRPRGAMLTHRGLVNFGMDALLRGAIDALVDDNPPAASSTSLHAGPFFHVSGLSPLLTTAPMSGTTLVFARPGRWDPAKHLELAARSRATVMSGVPTQIMRMLRHSEFDRFDLGALRRVGLGGAPISADLTNLLATRLPQVRPVSGYGMTETAGIGTVISGRELITHPQSIGLATPTANIALRDADGNDLPVEAAGQIGEIFVRCPSLFRGYWGDDQATRAAVHSDGWFRTGDYGRIAGGMLQLESRLRDLIIRGGENIYPIEIENRLGEHPDLLDAAVVGVPDDELGQEVVAAVVVRDGAVLTPDDVRAWVGHTLAAFKVPAYVVFMSGLPYNATGKVLKRELESAVDSPENRRKYDRVDKDA